MASIVDQCFMSSTHKYRLYPGAGNFLAISTNRKYTSGRAVFIHLIYGPKP